MFQARESHPGPGTAQLVDSVIRPETLSGTTLQASGETGAFPVLTAGLEGVASSFWEGCDLGLGRGLGRSAGWWWWSFLPPEFSAPGAAALKAPALHSGR